MSVSHRPVTFALAGFWVGLGALLVWGGGRPLPWLNHDVANALYVATKVLAGDVLYVDPAMGLVRIEKPAG